PEECRLYGDRRVEAVGRAAEGENIRIKRQFDCGKRTSRHGGSGVAVATRQRSTVCRFGNTSLYAGNERGNPAAECRSTRNAKACGHATTSAADRSRAICDANCETDSDGRALREA